MKVIIATSVLVVLGMTQPVFAQAGNSSGKRMVIYDERTNQMVEVQPEVQANQQEQQAAQSQTAPIYIMNSQKFDGSQDVAQGQGQNQIQSQPVSVIQDSPLVPSTSDMARKKRQSVEADTEDGIVSALERARLEDELRRRERFSNAIKNEPQQQQQQVIQQPVIQQPVIQQVETVQIATPVKVEKEKEEPKVDIRGEVRAALEESMPRKEEPSQKVYVSGLVGFGKYPDVVNIRGNTSAGVAIGMVTDKRIVAEGTFLYGKYQLEDLDPRTGGSPAFARIVDMRQYNFTLGAKYQLLPTTVKPTIGALAGYTHRKYTEYEMDLLTTGAFDLGLSAGLDVDLTPNFSVGAELRYMTNLTSHSDSDNRESFVYRSGAEEVEQLDYYTTTLMGKFSF